MPTQCVQGGTASRGAGLSPISARIAASGLYFHTLPGRLRIETPGLKGDSVLASRVTAVLERMQGVRSVRINSEIGRALIEFDPRVMDHDTLLEGMNRLPCFLPYLASLSLDFSGPGSRPPNGALRVATESLAKLAFQAALDELR